MCKCHEKSENLQEAGECAEKYNQAILDLNENDQKVIMDKFKACFHTHNEAVELENE